MKPKDMRDLTLKGMRFFLFNLQDRTIQMKTAGVLHPHDKEWGDSGQTLREVIQDCVNNEREVKFAIQWLQEMKFDSEGLMK